MKNVEEFVKWAESQGFDVVKPDTLHVTIAYSRTPVDTSKLKLDTHEYVYQGKTTVGPLGDEGGVVLFFNSPYLKLSWQRYIDAGASWDYDGYTPHVTISYDAKDVDLSKMKPYTGELRFYPETIENLDDDWTPETKG